MCIIPEKDLDDSYNSEYSNVAELWNTYVRDHGQFIGKVYVEGPGSAEPEKKE